MKKCTALLFIHLNLLFFPDIAFPLTPKDCPTTLKIQTNVTQFRDREENLKFASSLDYFDYNSFDFFYALPLKTTLIKTHLALKNITNSRCTYQNNVLIESQTVNLKVVFYKGGGTFFIDTTFLDGQDQAVQFGLANDLPDSSNPENSFRFNGLKTYYKVNGFRYFKGEKYITEVHIGLGDVSFETR